MKMGMDCDVRCDRWHHCSTVKSAGDYTKGLGPLGGNGRKPSVMQGRLQGSGQVPETERPPGPRRVPAADSVVGSGLDRVADGAEDLADLATQEDEGDDRDDGDQRQDQRVFREALAFLITIKEVHDCKVDVRHWGVTSFLRSSPDEPEAGSRYEVPPRTVNYVGCRSGARGHENAGPDVDRADRGSWDGLDRVADGAQDRADLA